MECVLIAVCETAVIDVKTNNLTLVNILQDINAAGFPALLHKTTLAAILDRNEAEPSETQGTIRFAVDGQAFFESSIRIDFQTHLRVRTIAEIQSIMIPKVGTLKCSLLYGERELGSWSLKIGQIGEPVVYSSPVIPPTG